MMTAMCSLTQRLLDDFPAVRTILAGVVRWDGYCHHTKHFPKIFQPISESRPCSIRYRLGQFLVPDHVPHLQVLVGDQVVRLDDAPCQFHGKVFTLPTYLQVFSRETVSRFDSILRAFLGTRKSLAKTLERLLRLPEVSGIFYSLPVRIGVEVSQSHIQPNGFPCWLSLLNPFHIKTELNVVPVGTTNNANALNLIQLIEVQIAGSPQLEASSLKAIGESDSSSIFRQLPACGFVFHTTMCLMLLKAWETLFTRLALLAVVVEPSNGTPSSFGRCLSSLRVKLESERELFSKNGAISAQLVLTNLLVVHPVSDATVSDESSCTNGFVKPFILLLFALKFCLKYQHSYADSIGVIISQLKKAVLEGRGFKPNFLVKPCVIHF